MPDNGALVLRPRGFDLENGDHGERTTISVRPAAAEHLLTWEGDQQFRALHEAAHCVIGTVLGIRMTSVDIKPRFYASAQVSLGDDDQPECIRASDHFARIVMLLAGPAIERLVLGEPTTGGTRDLHDATDAAIVRFDQGMDPNAPYVALTAFERPPESLKEAQATSVVRTLAEARARADALVVEHRDQILAFARRLYAARTLAGAEFLAALEDAGVEFGAVLRQSSTDQERA